MDQLRAPHSWYSNPDSMLNASSLLLLMLLGPPDVSESATTDEAVASPSEDPPAPVDALPDVTSDEPPATSDEVPAPSVEEPEPEPEPEARQPPPDFVPPPPTLVEATPARERWLADWFHACTPDTDPCVRSRRARGIVFAAGALSAVASVALIFSAGDRNRLGDPAMPLAGAGIIAMGAATIGATAAALHADGPTLYDRITPPTLGLVLGLGGSDITDEAVPYRLSGTFAPTFRFPKGLGRARPIGRVGGDLGSGLERDPRPQQTQADQFPVALESRSMRFDLGLDFALYLPYPVAQNPDRGHLGQFELRYKPLFFFARERLALGGEAGDGGVDRISQRVALTPLNLGLRWNLSPRQRMTFYMGPRWDLNAYGEPGSVATSKPALGPIYSEAWFDIDIPMRKLAWARQRGKPSVVGQFTTGYVHSRLSGSGINFGSVVGFLGQVVAQFAVRVRPLGSPVAYQLEVGANVGGGINPYLRFGIVLPDIGGSR